MPSLPVAARVAALCVVVALTNTAITRAQVPTVPVGTRVRIDVGLPNQELVGKVEFQAADIIAVETNGGTLSVPVSVVKRIDVSAGRSYPIGAARGMKIGALGLGGTVAFLLIASHFISKVDKCAGECIDALAFAPTLVPAGVVVGGVAGGVIGVLGAAEQWSGLYFAPPRVSLLPRRIGGTTVGLSLRF